jgi:predicted nucleic acid-binding protein
MVRLYALDSNVYIGALRDREKLARLKRFLIRAGTRVRLSAVVALELRAGGRSPAQADAVQSLVAAYDERGQVILPSFAAYMESGRALAALAAREGTDLSRAASLVADSLIAASCREAGAQLITENVRDFAALARHLRGLDFAGASEVL